MSDALVVRVPSDDESSDTDTSGSERADNGSESDDDKLPAVLAEPVDHDAVVYTSNRVRVPPKAINLNVAPEVPVLLESESPKEFDEMEEKLSVFDAAMNEMGFFKPDRSALPQYPNWCTPHHKLLGECHNSELVVVTLNSVGELTHLAQLHSLMMQLRRTNRHTTLCVTGPVWTAGAYAGTNLMGRHIASVFKKIGVDIMVPGSSDCTMDPAEFSARIVESGATMLCTNLRALVDNVPTRISKTTSYLIRHHGRVNILWCGIVGRVHNEWYDAESAQRFTTTNPVQSITEMTTAHQDKCTYTIVAGTVSARTAQGVCNVHNNLQLYIAGDVRNTCSAYGKVQLACSDPMTDNVYIHTIKAGVVRSTLVSLEHVPADPELLVHIAGWRDLAHFELRTYHNIDCAAQLIRIRGTLTHDALMRMYMLYLERKLTDFNINSIVLPCEYIRTDLSGTVTGYDVVRTFPLRDNCAILELDHNEYTDLTRNVHLTNKILNNKIGNKIVLCTTERTISTHIAHCLSTDFEAKILQLDVRTVYIELLRSLQS